MKVSEAAEKLLFELEGAEAKGAKYMQDDPLIKEKLNFLIGKKCHIFCRDRQGKSPCEIKNCCLAKNLLGCWKCEKLENCSKLNPQFLKNCQKINKLGINKFIEHYE